MRRTFLAIPSSGVQFAQIAYDLVTSATRLLHLSKFAYYLRFLLRSIRILVSLYRPGCWYQRSFVSVKFPRAPTFVISRTY